MIRPPKGCPDAVPTPQGWVHPTSGKVILVRRLANSDIMEYRKHAQESGKTAAQPIIEADPVVEEVSPTAEPLIEAEPEVTVSLSADLSSMTKSQLVEWAEDMGIELDMSMTKSEMIELLEE